LQIKPPPQPSTLHLLLCFRACRTSPHYNELPKETIGHIQSVGCLGHYCSTQCVHLRAATGS
jgi:hypothetical protein